MVTEPTLVIDGVVSHAVTPALPVIVHVATPVGATPPEPVATAVNVITEPSEPVPTPERMKVGVT